MGRAQNGSVKLFLTPWRRWDYLCCQRIGIRNEIPAVDLTFDQINFPSESHS